MPKYQVPKFQTIAELSKAVTITKLCHEATFTINSTGNKDTIEKATAPLDVKTPRKLQIPDHITAEVGLRVFV
jgi:hypothetical protein